MPCWILAETGGLSVGVAAEIGAPLATLASGLLFAVSLYRLNTNVDKAIE
jgi:hypothetical protein